MEKNESNLKRGHLNTIPGGDRQWVKLGAETKHCVSFTLESQSQPKRGVARTEQRDMMRKARAILVMGKSKLVDRKGERVA